MIREIECPLCGEKYWLEKKIGWIGLDKEGREIKGNYISSKICVNCGYYKKQDYRTQAMAR